jgi:hypothetical protein
MVLGEMTSDTYESVRILRLPRFAGEQYCDSIQLAPGLTVRAFVPTAAEKTGDYSLFSGAIIDPLTNTRFPGNVIPTYRLPGLLAWHLPAQ